MFSSKKDYEEFAPHAGRLAVMANWLERSIENAMRALQYDISRINLLDPAPNGGVAARAEELLGMLDKDSRQSRKLVDAFGDVLGRVQEFGKAPYGPLFLRNACIHGIIERKDLRNVGGPVNYQISDAGNRFKEPETLPIILTSEDLDRAVDELTDLTRHVGSLTHSIVSEDELDEAYWFYPCWD